MKTQTTQTNKFVFFTRFASRSISRWIGSSVGIERSFLVSILRLMVQLLLLMRLVGIGPLFPHPVLVAGWRGMAH